MEIINEKEYIQKVGGDTPFACGVVCAAACMISTVATLFGHMIVSY